MKYLIDSSVFIQAKNLHYGFDFCPAFWDWLVQQHDADKVGSIEKVGDELKAGQDILADWAVARGMAFFPAPDAVVVPALGQVSSWANTQRYEPAAVATFLQVADYWLVAHAQAHQCVIVTNEVPAQTVKKIKIPNACLGLGVQCVTPYEMLRRERAKFVLGQQAG